MAQLRPPRHFGFRSYWVCPTSGSRLKRPYNFTRFHRQSISLSQSTNPFASYASSNPLSRQGSSNTNPYSLLVPLYRGYSTGPSPRALSTPPLRYLTILALILGLGSLSSGAIVYALENGDASNIQNSNDSQDPLDALLPEKLKQRSNHITQKSTPDLLQSYMTMLMCEFPGFVTYGPALLNGCATFRDHVPIIGPIVWSGLEWIIYSTFFNHYVGGESIHDCQPVIESLYDHNIGALLNYSVEASEKSVASDHSSNKSQIFNDSIQTISQAVDTLANRSFSFGGNCEAGSAKMKPIAIAIKISGLLNDPYLFKRASENLAANHLSPFKAGGELFPVIPNAVNQSDPLSQSDHVALRDLMNDLRVVCRKAKAADIVLMMDAEYSWFQPALDRIVTFLSDEFNRAQRDEKFKQLNSCSPTVFNTFQTLLRSTPARLDEFLNDAQERGYSIGIKLVRGAYLTSETHHWLEQKSQGKLEASEELPVWSSKSETDDCFDTIASSLVSRLSNSARQAARLSKASTDDEVLSNSIETSLMIAGHNPLSILKVLKQLRDKEHLAEINDFMGTPSLQLSNSLRGRLMFAQLYGMADNLTTTLTQILAASDSGQKQLQPFVFKYLPFGPVEKVLPYLARRAEENQSILQSPDGQTPLKLERKLLGREIRRRFISFISFS